MKIGVRKACVLFVGMTALFLSSVVGAEAERPNVLFIISDDLNNDLGTYGRPQFLTPNIDRLAQQGLQFQRAYCQMPFCNPSRSSMLSSLYTEQTEIYALKTPIREKFENIVTMPELFKQHGYRTARVGKIYHQGVPTEIGMDGLDDPQSWDYVHNPIGRDKTEEPKVITLVPGKYGGTLSWLAMDGTDEEQTDGKGATEVIRLLEDHKANHAEDPFFLAYGLYRPHTPFVAPQKYFDLYPIDTIEVPRMQHPRIPLAAFRHARSVEDGMTERQRQEAKQAYHASSSFMDAQVGRVLDSLERLGLSENTIVVFTSDHGYLLGEHGLWKKRSLFEQSARVPLIISAPGHKGKAQKTDSLSELVDLYPTLASLCNLPIPEYVMGTDLSPLFSDPQLALKPVAFTQETRQYREKGKLIRFKGYSIRAARYRYTEWDDGKQGVELYDHESDPEEMNNLAGKSEARDVQQEMAGLLAAKLADIRAKNLDSIR